MCDPDTVARRHALDWLAAAHARQHKLCALLEEIADALPGPIDRVLVVSAIPPLRTAIARHNAILARILFPILRKRASDAILDALITQISSDNAADELLAHDTADALEAAAPGGRADNPGMLAYMLRCLFEGRRRHITWETAVLVPLARERLGAEDLTPLSEAEIHALLTTGRGRRTSDDRSYR